MTSTTATPELPRNSRVVLLSLVPGLGHFYLDRFNAGALLFVSFVTALNALFLGSTLHSLQNPELVRNAAGVAVVLIWALGMWHAYSLSYGTDRIALSKQRKELVRRALVHYLRDELEEARKLLKQAVDLDIDWVDPDPLFHLGVILARMAERAALRSASDARALRRKALATLKACQARDGEAKWEREVAVEQRRLSRKGSRRQTAQFSSSASGIALSGAESTDMLPSLAQLSQSGQHVSLGKALKERMQEEAPEPEVEAEAHGLTESGEIDLEKRYPSESAAFRKLLFGDGNPPIDVELIDPEESLPPNRPRSRRLTSRRLAKARLLERLESEDEFDALRSSDEIPPASERPTRGIEEDLDPEADAEEPVEPDELGPEAEAETDAEADAETEADADVEASTPVGAGFIPARAKPEAEPPSNHAEEEAANLGDPDAAPASPATPVSRREDAS